MSLKSMSKGCVLPAGPVNILIESTGLKVYGAGEWLQEKQKVRTRRTWRKLHLAVDANTGWHCPMLATARPTQMHSHAGGPAGSKPKLYNPRHPERTLLYQTIAEHFETWHSLASAGQFDGQGDHHSPKPYVRQAFRKYLECGIFAHGFARAWCDDSGHDYFVAYSCRGRGVCPSCNTRRMVETAAHLTDHVFPRLPVRQWVLSVPKRLRYFMQRDGAVLNMVLRIFLRVIAQSLQDHSSGAASVDKAALHIGAVAFIHRFAPV